METKVCSQRYKIVGITPKEGKELKSIHDFMRNQTCVFLTDGWIGGEHSPCLFQVHNSDLEISKVIITSQVVNSQEENNTLHISTMNTDYYLVPEPDTV